VQAAGERTLGRERLSLWLAQDRIYALAYPRLIAQLITKIPEGDANPPACKASSHDVLKLLTLSLDNIVKEIQFFEWTAEAFKMDVGKWRQRKGTRDYTAEMARVGSFGTLWEGLVFLWAMEKVYLDAWTFEKHSGPHPAQADAISAFIEHWSAPGFVKFVHDLEHLVNAFSIDVDSEEWRNAERIWERVLELEVGFWPNEGEENDELLCVRK